MSEAAQEPLAEDVGGNVYCECALGLRLPAESTVMLQPLNPIDYMCCRLVTSSLFGRIRAKLCQFISSHLSFYLSVFSEPGQGKPLAKPHVLSLVQCWEEH